MKEVIRLLIPESKPFPNSVHPVLIYREVFNVNDDSLDFQALFSANAWQGIWENGVYSYHHFHAEAHEALACSRGWVSLQVGGPQGVTLMLNKGDALLLPAGVGHKRLESSQDYLIIGAYPPQQSPDLQRGKPEDFERLSARVLLVPVPLRDPVFGTAFVW